MERRKNVARSAGNLTGASASPRLAMRSPSPAAEVDDHGDQKPHKIDPRCGHPIIDLPRVHDGGEGQENETEEREQQTAMECPLQIVREKPDQEKR